MRLLASLLALALGSPLLAQEEELPKPELEPDAGVIALAELLDEPELVEASRVAAEVERGSLLHRAALGCQDPARVVALLETGADPNETDYARRTALHYAVIPAGGVGERTGKCREVLAALIEAGADVHATAWWNYKAFDRTPLHAAAELNPNPDVVRTLIEAGADVDRVGGFDPTASPLDLALRYNPNPEVAHALLDAGADPLTSHGYGRTPLHHAAFGGKPGLVKRLLRAGADPGALGKRGETPLHQAAAFGSPLAEWLRSYAGFGRPCVRSGAEPPRMNYPSRAATTAEHLAVRESGRLQLCDSRFRRGRLEVVRLLLRSGADPAVPDSEGLTPLLRAARSSVFVRVVAALLAADDGGEALLASGGGRAVLEAAVEHNLSGEVVSFLLQTFGPPDAKLQDRMVYMAVVRQRSPALLQWLLTSGFPLDGEWTRQALASAAARGDVDLVRVLIEAGADVDAPNGGGSSALDFAVARGPLEIVEMLLAAEASVEAGDRLIAGVRDLPTLHLLLETGLEAIPVLLAAGASRTALDAEGRTPLDLAGGEGQEAWVTEELRRLLAAASSEP